MKLLTQTPLSQVRRNPPVDERLNDVEDTVASVAIDSEIKYDGTQSRIDDLEEAFTEFMFGMEE